MKFMDLALIFDFDGTVANSIEAILQLINKLAPSYGFETLSQETFNSLRDLPIPKACRKLHFPLAKLPQAIATVLNEYKHIISDLTPCPGIDLVIRKLKEWGIVLGLISSNDTEHINNFLKRNNLDCFDWVEGTKGILRKHNSISAQIKKHQLNPKHTFYIGDEVRDIKAAHRSKVKVISVIWGLHSEENLLRHNPDFLIRKPEELLDLVQSLKSSLL